MTFDATPSRGSLVHGEQDGDAIMTRTSHFTSVPYFNGEAVPAEPDFIELAEGESIDDLPAGSRPGTNSAADIASNDSAGSSATPASVEFSEFRGDEDTQSETADSPAESSGEIPAPPAWHRNRETAVSDAGEASSGTPRSQRSPQARTSSTAPPATGRRLQRRGAARRQQASQPALVATAAPEEELPWDERLKQWFISFAAVGYGVSLMVHFAILLILSMVFFTIDQLDKRMVINATEGEKDVLPVETIDTRLDVAGGNEQQTPPQFQVVQTPISEMAAPEFPEFADPSSAAGGAGSGDSSGDGSGQGGLNIRVGNNAVTKGSFTAWTVPEDPAPGQNYMIMIRIKLPDKVRRYPRRDLSGMVVGTDGYRQPIPGSTRGYLPTKDRESLLTIPVPGAQRLVEDSIEIRSKLLDEKQSLKIVF